MAELELIGLHEDGEHLVLAAADGQRYRLHIDEPLRAARHAQHDLTRDVESLTLEYHRKPRRDSGLGDHAMHKCRGRLLAIFRRAYHAPVDHNYKKGTVSAEMPKHSCFFKEKKSMVSPYDNPSCYLLAFHGILRFNEGEISTTLSEEEPHGRQNYSDILPV